MSYYVWDSGLTYNDYLQAKSFIDDIVGVSHENQQKIRIELSHQTREIIASEEALSREQINIIRSSSDRMTKTISEGFNQVSQDLETINFSINQGFGQVSEDLQQLSSDIKSGFDQISYDISKLNATFHWGFGQIIAVLGHMNDTLSELVKIAKTPIQTVAFNHFDIARDAFRQGLFQEALEELQRAIHGDQTSSGYKLEWRFHQMMGTIRLGFVNCDLSLVDLPQAEQSFLLAARYAKMDYPAEAGLAFLSAGYAAYCQGKKQEAKSYTNQAIALLPQFGEVYFQAAKIHISTGELNNAMPFLEKAIDIDQVYALKASGDGDFQKYDKELQQFLEKLSKDRLSRAQTNWENIKSLRKHSPFGDRSNSDFRRIDSFITQSKIRKKSLFDIIAILKAVDSIVAEMNPERIDDIYSKTGKLLTSIEFCKIPQKTERDFYIGKYPVTQEQWQAIMGNNPSYRKGSSKLPVENVSWFDCQTFIKKLNELVGKNLYRLPSEIEWEYACRSGSYDKYCFGNNTDQLKEYAWYLDNSRIQTHEVGTLKPNNFGVYDMHGNVWEWMENVFHKGSSFRALRGGSWGSDEKELHCASRNFEEPNKASGQFGFRLLREAEGAGPASKATATKEKTGFSVILTRGGANRINVINVVRSLTNLGLKEAIDLVDGAPKVLKEGVNKEEAQQIKVKLEEAGATVEIR